jgi:hypothetical protein
MINRNGEEWTKIKDPRKLYCISGILEIIGGAGAECASVVNSKGAQFKHAEAEF